MNTKITRRNRTNPTAARSAAPAPTATAGPINGSSHPGFVHYESMKDRFAAQKQTRRVLNVDIEQAGTVLITAHGKIVAGGLAPRLAALPSTHFDATILDRLIPYGWALRYIATMRQTEAATVMTRRISPDLAARSTAVYGRMLKVAKHVLGERPEYANELAAIEEGRSYESRAQALMRLSIIYHAEQDVLSKDPVYYLATDADEAQACYGQMLSELNGVEPQTWSAVAFKAFSVIEREYADLRHTVLWLCRDEPEAQAAVPTLFPRGGWGSRAADGPAEASPAPAGTESTEAGPTLARDASGPTPA